MKRIIWLQHEMQTEDKAETTSVLTDEQRTVLKTIDGRCFFNFCSFYLDGPISTNVLDLVKKDERTFVLVTAYGTPIGHNALFVQEFLVPVTGKEFNRIELSINEAALENRKAKPTTLVRSAQFQSHGSDRSLLEKLDGLKEDEAKKILKAIEVGFFFRISFGKDAPWDFSQARPVFSDIVETANGTYAVINLDPTPTTKTDISIYITQWEAKIILDAWREMAVIIAHQNRKWKALKEAGLGWEDYCRDRDAAFIAAGVEEIGAAKKRKEIEKSLQAEFEVKIAQLVIP